MKSSPAFGLVCAVLGGSLAIGSAGCSDDSGGSGGEGGASSSTTLASGTASNATSAGATSGATTASSTSGSSSASTSTGGPQPTVRFVAFGDAGKGNQGQVDVANAIATHCAANGCDFVQLLGDNIYDSGVDSTSDPQWQSKFELPYAPVDLDFWVVLGNHDYGGNGAGYEFGKGQNEVDYTNVSTKWKLPSKYWQRQVEHVQFVGLDTNMAMYSQAADQEADVPGWLAQSTATWKIVLGHHPYRSNGPHGNAGEYDGLPFIPVTNGAGVKSLVEGVVCGHADVYLSGHDHDMQWHSATCNGTELIVSGAGASTTQLEGSNPVHFESEQIGFLYVVIEGNSFTGEFIGADGSTLFSRTITK